MRSVFITIWLVLSCTAAFPQSSYSGFIDKYPIKLVLPSDGENNVEVVYVYTKFDDPVVIAGKKSGDTLLLFEKDTTGKNTASLAFTDFDVKHKTLIGTWTNLLTKKQLIITLQKDFDIDETNGIGWLNRELIQPFTLRGQYFNLVIAKDSDGDGYVARINIYQQRTDSLAQHFDINCQLQGINNLAAGDFNFDGYKDFSVFEMHHAGPNTTNLYFLYAPVTKKYIASGFEGVSLEFDEQSKTISEHNQCCGGNQHTTAIYKVVNNKMVLKEHHCFIYDEKTQDLVDHNWKDCE